MFASPPVFSISSGWWGRLWGCRTVFWRLLMPHTTIVVSSFFSVCLHTNTTKSNLHTTTMKLLPSRTELSRFTNANPIPSSLAAAERSTTLSNGGVHSLECVLFTFGHTPLGLCTTTPGQPASAGENRTCFFLLAVVHRHRFASDVLPLKMWESEDPERSPILLQNFEKHTHTRNGLPKKRSGNDSPFAPLV